MTSPSHEIGTWSVLIIDDDDSVRSSLGAVLETSGYNVATAANGEEGLSLLARSTFDIVLCLGIFYHIMDHYRLLNLIRQLKPRLVILDNSTQMYGGDVNDRSTVVRFLQALNKLALEIKHYKLFSDLQLKNNELVYFKDKSTYYYN